MARMQYTNSGSGTGNLRFVSPFAFNWWSGARVTLWIIAINFAIWLFFIIGNAVTSGTFAVFFKQYLAEGPENTFQKLYLWTLITSGFVHFDFLHVANNMLLLFIFGPQIERDFGSRRYLFFYLLCLVGSGIISILAKTIMITLNTNPNAFGETLLGVSIGASGAVMGVLIAYGLTYPMQTIYPFGLFPLRMLTLVLAIVVIQIAMAIQDTLAPGSGGCIDYWAHIGGLATGFIYMKMPRLSGRGGGSRGPRVKVRNWRGEEKSDERSYYLEI